MATWMLQCSEKGGYTLLSDDTVVDAYTQTQYTIESLKENEQIIYQWTCGNVKSIEVGDTIFLKRSNSGQDNGFYARGFAVVAEEPLNTYEEHQNLSAAYEASFWEDGRLRVSVSIESVVDFDQPLKEEFLIKKLKCDKKQFYSRGARSIQDEYVEGLNFYWEEYVSSMEKQGHGIKVESSPETEPDKTDEFLFVDKENKNLDDENFFDLKEPQTTRKRILRSIAQRRGQSQFRRELLKIFGSRCVVTGCDAEEALEAAHILPYSKNASNSVSNGLLFRADLHTLFDLYLIAIKPSTMTLQVAPKLLRTSYGELDGKPLSLPEKISREALGQRWKDYELKNSLNKG